MINKVKQEGFDILLKAALIIIVCTMVVMLVFPPLAFVIAAYLGGRWIWKAAKANSKKIKEALQDVKHSLKGDK